jgi:adenylyltransferase/sulfurtransferase
LDPKTYYSRQILLPEIGSEGQKKLQNGKVLVVGAGGLGSPALLYLAGAGVGTIGICDGDLLEESNLHRQPLYAAQNLSRPKAELSKTRIAELNPHITVHTYPYRLTAENAKDILQAYDIVLDCTDNFQTKFLINDAALFIRKPVIRASIYQFEGQIQTYIPNRGDACLRCLWPETPQEGCVGTCGQVGVLGPVPGFFGVLQAVEALKFFLGMPTLKKGQILFSDLIHYTQQVISFERNPDCPLCGEAPTIKQLRENELWELSLSDLKNGQFHLIDIRELEERLAQPYSGLCSMMPLSTFNPANLDRQSSYAIFCQKGKRSQHLVQSLRAQGLSKVYSIIGGIEKLISCK